MQQVKDSPEIDTERPVSRQIETNIYDYYGWSPYWGSGLYMGGYGYMAAMAILGGAGHARRLPAKSSGARRQIADARRERTTIRISAASKTVTGYHIHASDGEIGHVEDFLVEDADWSIHYLVVDTKNWWPGKKVLISPRSAREIDWTDKLVNLDVDRQRVKDSPPYDPSTAVDRAYEKHFHSYYGEVGSGGRP